MDPLILQLTETVTVGEEFKKADVELGEALKLVDDDIKWDMLMYLAPRFEALSSRQDAAKLMTGPNYNREFLLQELREMTKETRALTEEIRTKMEALDGKISSSS